MATIQEQIKALQRTQAKIDALNKIRTDVASYSDHPEHEGLTAEIVAELSQFLDSQIDGLSNAKPIASSQINGSPVQASADGLKPEEVQVLKMLAEKAQGKMNAPVASAPKSLASQKRPPQDILQFAQQNRHLEGKRIRLNTHNGPVLGKVVGLNYPNIIVTTDTDHTVETDLEKIEIL